MTTDATSPAVPPRRRRRKRFMLTFLIIFLLPVFVGAGVLAYRGGRNVQLLRCGAEALMPGNNLESAQ